MRDFKILIFATCCLGAFSQLGSAAPLAAHRALYELEPKRLDQSSTVVPMGGRIAYELTGSDCEGYTVNYRIANRYHQNEKGEQLIDTQLSTFESADGLELSLSQKQFLNNQLSDEERLSVRRPKTGAEGKGVMSKPKELEFSVRSDALFPSAHEQQIIAQAVKGLSHDDAIVFDGSDGEKLYKAVTFIGKKRSPGAFATDSANPEARPLASFASWPITVSYYPLENEEAATPSYQASFNVYENGVTTDLVLDYGSYALKGRLVKLEMLKTEACQVKPAGN